MGETKICAWCNKEKELNEYYTQNKTRKDGTRWIYYHPECKQCTKERATIWKEENPESYQKAMHKRNNKPITKERLKVSNEKRTKEGKYREWRQAHPEKVKIYNEKYKEEKSFKITNKEWKSCKDYFNNECSYCGMSEVEAKDTYEQLLHKEHAINNGANDISNCIPSCKGCNSSKITNDYIEWYTPDNEVFSQDRFEKINQWLTNDYKTLENNTCNNISKII